jgi:hypothetical protein
MRFYSSNGGGAKHANGSAVCRVALLGLLLGAVVAIGADVIPGGYVKVQPGAATLAQNTTLQLGTAVLNPAGFELPNRMVSWWSGSPGLLPLAEDRSDLLAILC